MVKIRLKQTGKRNARKYRIVVVHSTDKRNGKEIETIGHYDPMPAKSIMVMNVETTDKWLKNGAVMTERVAKIYNLVKNNKVEK